MGSAIDGGVVLITGASSGIGRELARRVATRARALVLVARRRDRLEALRAELATVNSALRVHVAPCDLADRAQTDAMLDDVAREVGDVDVLVNNAGFGDLSLYDLADWARTEQMIALNVTSVAYLTHRLVRGMVARRRGGVLNVSSGWGMTFAPGLAAYVATKHFVTGFTESLRLDLAGTGVTVTQSCPGPVATEFADHVGNFTGMATPRAVEISAEACARQTLRGFDRGRAMVVPGVVIRVALWLSAVTPRWVLRLVYTPIAKALRAKQAAARPT